ncbi:gliding motility-associated C-terminal domain-containing protein [Lishizhenia tianjinensis]|uniref:Gliding motility-associated C-terminal domain-containing protein n=1 Tax=Lishizhenia tianjinensis TaxID=477690 RepID=A0A1I7BUI9_9FLAO|nr:gliding motility-associated C-terminal domain-containing protein [Lishizhenia tianjinensis]SFT90823.1 gliding motility-associated C-terminal domain-containing protein [Lishizhenia tianjinensis]
MQLRQQIFIFIITVVLVMFTGTTFSVAQSLGAKTVIPAPQINCIQTDATNNLIINWTSATDPDGSFVEYQVHELANGQLTSSNTIATNSYASTLSATQAYPFFLGLVSNDNGNVTSYSDTVRNIFLELNNPSNGTAVLNWNVPRTNPLPGFGTNYEIYREYPVGTWTLIATPPYTTTSYIDTIDICSAFLNYRIELPTTTCAFTSNIEGDDFQDDIVPDIPELGHVSFVEASGQYEVTWGANSQDDTYGYVIYMQDANGVFIEIDTVYGINATSYNYTPTGDGPFRFTIAAFDSCFTMATPPTYQTSAKGSPHKSMWLTGGSSACSQDVELNWTAYQGFGATIVYDVYSRVLGGAWQLEGTTDQLSYVFARVPGTDYDFKIVARIAGEEATSNIHNQPWEGASGPSVAYISHASVVGDEIEIVHKVSLDGGIQSVKLQRLNLLNATYETIDEKAVGNGVVTFYDADVDVYDEVYEYQTVMIDSCGNEYPPINIVQNMVLQTNIDPLSLLVEMQWTEYEEFLGTTVSYEIYRGIDGVMEDLPLTVMGANNRFYSESLAGVVDEDFTGQVCYYVKAKEGANPLGDSDSSASNISCVILEPLIYIPNAFSVNGANPVFYPVTNYHQLEQYAFTIYNRYGQVLFHTEEKGEGWDGYLENGQIAREGVYVYRLSLRDGNGIEVLRHGHLTLLNATDE